MPTQPIYRKPHFCSEQRDTQFGQDFTLYEALRTVDRLFAGKVLLNRLIYNRCVMTKGMHKVYLSVLLIFAVNCYWAISY